MIDLLTHALSCATTFAHIPNMKKTTTTTTTTTTTQSTDRRRNIEAEAVPSYVRNNADESLEEKVEHFRMLADDAEARGARQEAAARHEDRIEAATAAAAARAGVVFLGFSVRQVCT